MYTVILCYTYCNQCTVQQCRILLVELSHLANYVEFFFNFYIVRLDATLKILVMII